MQRSAILDELNERLPSDTLLKALARIDPFPRVDGPEVDVGPPRAGSPRDPDVRRAGESVVKILGNACGLGVSGSGWVAGDGHRRHERPRRRGAGRDRSSSRAATGGRLDATAIAFDAKNDIAVLRVAGLGAAGAGVRARRQGLRAGGHRGLPAGRAVSRSARRGSGRRAS